MPTLPQHRIIEYKLSYAAPCNTSANGVREYRVPGSNEAPLVWSSLKIHAFHPTNGVEIVEPSQLWITLNTDDDHTFTVVPAMSIRGPFEFPAVLAGLSAQDESSMGYRIFVRPPAADAMLQITLYGYLDRESLDRSQVLVEQDKCQVVRVHERERGDSVWAVEFSEGAVTRLDLQP